MNPALLSNQSPSEKGGVNPKISVIIPVYNGERFIRRSLESVFNQTFAPHEIIVVNDGSKDGTQQILDSYAGRIRSKTIPNGGVAHARNEAIHLATGDYLAFLDADDSWFRQKLQVTVEYIQKYPQAGFFSSDYVERVAFFGNHLRPNSTMIAARGKIRYNEPLNFHPLKLLLVHNVGIAPSAVVMKKRAAEDAGLFNPQCKLVEDLDFYLRVALHTDFVLIRDTLMFKHNYDDNMSHNKLRMALGRTEVVQNFMAAHKDALENKDILFYVRRSLANCSYKTGDIYFEMGEYRLAFAAYREALNHLSSPGNLMSYTWKISKKMARLMTADRLSRKNIKKALS